MKIEEIVIQEIKKFIKENWGTYDNNSENWIYDLYEKRDEIMSETLQEWMESKKGQKQSWTLIPFPRLKKIWEDSVKYGFIRDEKGLQMIKNIMIDNVLQLDVNTEIMGHSTHYPEQEIEDLGYTMDQFHAKLDSVDDDYFIAPNGQWRLSDYGLKPLMGHAERLLKTQDPMQQLTIIDQMLNVVHQRSDLASWFVEGGSAALSQLSGT